MRCERADRDASKRANKPVSHGHRCGSCRALHHRAGNYRNALHFMQETGCRSRRGEDQCLAGIERLRRCLHLVVASRGKLDQVHASRFPCRLFHHRARLHPRHTGLVCNEGIGNKEGTREIAIPVPFVFLGRAMGRVNSSWIVTSRMTKKTRSSDERNPRPDHAFLDLLVAVLLLENPRRGRLLH